MKKVLCYALLGIGFWGLVNLFSCSDDDEFYGPAQYELQTYAAPQTRAGVEGGAPDEGNPNQYRSNECSIWCVVQLLGGNNYQWHGVVQDSAKTLGWKDNGSVGLDPHKTRLLANKFGILLSETWYQTGVKEPVLHNDGSVIETNFDAVITKLNKMVDDKNKFTSTVLICTNNHVTIGEELHETYVKVKNVNAVDKIYYNKLYAIVF